MIRLGLPVALATGGPRCHLEPGDPVTGVQAQRQEDGSSIRVFAAEPGRLAASSSARGSPGLPGADVGPFEVKEDHAPQDTFATLLMELLRSTGSPLIVSGQAQPGCLDNLFFQHLQIAGSRQADLVVLLVAARSAVVAQQATVAQGLQARLRFVLIQSFDRWTRLQWTG